VGAADGHYLSNTAKLDAMGWQGIALDPLLKNFESRRNTRAIQAAVYSQVCVLASAQEGLCGNLDQLMLGQSAHTSKSSCACARQTVLISQKENISG